MTSSSSPEPIRPRHNMLASAPDGPTTLRRSPRRAVEFPESTDEAPQAPPTQSPCESRPHFLSPSPSTHAGDLSTSVQRRQTLFVPLSDASMVHGPLPTPGRQGDTSRHQNENRLEAMLLGDATGILPSPTRFNTPSNFSTSRLDCMKERPRYEVPPPIPLRRPIRRLLEVTEFPFMVLWTFFTYWLVILCFSASETTRSMWFSAIFAGIVVGMALNANAYKYIVKPKTRSRRVAHAAGTSYESDSMPVTGPPRPSVTLMQPSPVSRTTRPTFQSSPYDELNSQKEDEGVILTVEEQEAQRSHLMKMIVRFPRFFNQLVTTKRQCVPTGQYSLHRIEQNEMDAHANSTHPSIANTIPPQSSPSPMRHTNINAFSSGMNSLTKLAKDWSIFSDTLEWELDIPTMIRFFIIPFAVSAISGMTSDEDKYVLVFPKDPVLATIACGVPAAWVTLLVMARLALLYSLNVVWRWKVIFFNGCLIH